MLEVLGQDYVRTARTKGLSAGVVVWKHAFRNVIDPGRHVVGIIVEPAPERVGRDRDRLLGAGDRTAHGVGRAPARLPGDPGRAPRDRRRASCCSTCWSTCSMPTSIPASATCTTSRPGGGLQPPLAGALGRVARSRVARRLRRHRSFLIGIVLVGLVVGLAVLADLIAPTAPDRMQFRDRFAPPSSRFWLGTDNFGRDILSRVVYGARLSLEIGCGVMLLSGVAGTLVGALAGYYRRLDGLLMRVMDALHGVPGRPARDRHHGRPRAVDGKRDDRAHRRLHAADGAHRPSLGTGDPRAGLRAGRPRGRRPARAASSCVTSSRTAWRP